MRTEMIAVILVAMLAGMSALAESVNTNKTQQQVRLEIDLVDGSRVIGVPKTKVVPVQTTYAKLDIALEQILTITINKDHKTGAIALRNGDDLKGVIHLEPIGLDTLFGNITVGMENIIRIRVVLSGGTLSGKISNGLLLHYSCDADGEVLDASGNGRNGTAIGAIWTPNGKRGGAYKVGRGIGYIKVADQDAWSFAKKDFSICLWLKLNTRPLGEEGLIGHNEGGGSRNKWVFQLNNGNLCFHINNRRRKSFRIAAYPWNPEIGVWYNLSVTRKQNTYTIYINGLPVSEAENALPIPTVNAPLTIGQAEELYVNGTLDEVMIFDRTLSREDISRICGIDTML